MALGRKILILVTAGVWIAVIAVAGSRMKLSLPAKLLDPAQQSTLEVVSSVRGRSLYVEVNQGVFAGETPLTIKNLLVDAEHTLTYYPEWPLERGRQRCRFRLTSLAPEESYLLTLQMPLLPSTKLKSCTLQKRKLRKPVKQP